MYKISYKESGFPDKRAIKNLFKETVRANSNKTILELADELQSLCVKPLKLYCYPGIKTIEIRYKRQPILVISKLIRERVTKWEI